MVPQRSMPFHKMQRHHCCPPNLALKLMAARRSCFANLFWKSCLRFHFKHFKQLPAEKFLVKTVFSGVPLRRETLKMFSQQSGSQHFGNQQSGSKKCGSQESSRQQSGRLPVVAHHSLIATSLTLNNLAANNLATYSPTANCNPIKNAIRISGARPSVDWRWQTHLIPADSIYWSSLIAAILSGYWKAF